MKRSFSCQFHFISTTKTEEDTVQVPTTSNRSINVWRGRKKMNNDINGVSDRRWLWDNFHCHAADNNSKIARNFRGLIAIVTIVKISVQFRLDFILSLFSAYLWKFVSRQSLQQRSRSNECAVSSRNKSQCKIEPSLEFIEK